MANEIKQESEKKENQQEEKKTDWSAILQKGEEIATRIEAANKESQRILEQQQELAARKLLGGETEAGQPTEKPKEETPKEYAKRVLTGKL